MKILHVTAEYPPVEGYGVALYVSELSRSLRDLGQEVHVLVTRWSEEHSPGAKAAVHYLSNPYPFFGYSPCLDNVLAGIPACERLVALWESEGPFDVVIGHDWTSSLAATMAQRVYACPLIAVLHGIHAGKGGSVGPEQTYIAEMERWFSGRADRVVVLSEFSRGEVERHYGVPKEKVTVIPGGAAAQTFSTELDRDDFRSMFAEPGERIILFVGRLTHEKGTDVLLSAVQTMLARGSRLKVVLAGDGPLRASLTEESERRGLKEVIRCAGHLGPSVLGALYQVSDVLAVPSRYDSFGWSTIEAVLHGLPVVASSCGALSGLARQLPSGAMSPVIPGDAEGLARMLEEVLKGAATKTRDRRPLEKRVPGSMSWEKLADKMASLCDSLMAAPKG
jgi:glycogen(starch) synthase